MELGSGESNTANKASNVLHLDFARNQECRARCAKKVEIFGKFLEEGVVMLVLDARCEGVSVPKEIAHEYDLRLNFSYTFRISDFIFDQKTVEASLAFPSGTCYVVIPWKAVYGLQSESTKRAALWPEDTPEEMQAEPVSNGQEIPNEDIVSSPISQTLRLVTED